MSLSQKIDAALEARPANGALPCDVTVEHDANRLTIHLTATGAVGVAFSTLKFSAQSRPEWSPDSLRRWGDHLATRLTYLMEPLIVLEQDPVAGEVELRSQSPTARGGNRSFYEVRLNRQGTLVLSRVAFDEASRKRVPIACQTTREVLERLADDIVESAR